MKKITIDVFKKELTTLQTRTSYLLVGDEPLFISEAEQTIYQQIKQANIFDKYKWEIDGKTKWNDIFTEIQANDLFSSNKLIHLILPDSITKELQNNLTEFVNLLDDNIYLLLQLNKLSLTITKQDWFNLLQDKTSLIQIDCNQVEKAKLAGWINLRASNLELKLDQEVINLLIFAYEGNLLALQQTLTFLKLLYPNSEVTKQRVEQIASESAVFKPYTWIDELFSGNIERAIRILKSLQEEDFTPVILLRSIQRELQVIWQILNSYIPQSIDDNFPLDLLKPQYDALKVWQSRRQIYTMLIKRLTYRQMYSFWGILLKIEKDIKTNFSGSEWMLLEKLSLAFKN